MEIVSVQVGINDQQRSFAYRKDSSGDVGVIQQIFRDNDYNISRWHQGRKLLNYHELQSKTRPSLIVDAGANIGASAVYFGSAYSNSAVFAIEPDSTNHRLLSLNTTSLNCFAFHGAISDVDGELALVDPGRSDWGFMTAPVEGNAAVNKVKSICPESILAHEFAKGTTPLIFKIDIEGGEEALFRGQCEWMNKFPLVIIELHDWMLPFAGSSKSFINALARYDFDIIHHGENTFLFNRSILS